MCIVGEGTVEILIYDPKQQCEIVVLELGVGACIGEMAWVTGMPRAASVRASSPRVVVYEVSLKGMNHLSQTIPSFLANICRFCGRRIALDFLMNQEGDLFRSWRRHDLHQYLSRWQLITVDNSIDNTTSTSTSISSSSESCASVVKT